MDFSEIFETLKNLPKAKTEFTASLTAPLQQIGSDVEEFAKWQLTFQAISAISVSIVALIAISNHLRKR